MTEVGSIDRTETLKEEDAVVVRAKEDQIQKFQILNKRLQGYSLVQISRMFGIKQKELEKLLVRWLREEVGHDKELGQVLADLTFTRYESLLAKILPALYAEEVHTNLFKNLVKMFTDISDRQLRVAGLVIEETKASAAVDDTDLTALEEEAKRLGMTV